ncbi:hypothetical protein MRX96_031435 [Rhipicephalus microplus]
MVGRGDGGILGLFLGGCFWLVSTSGKEDAQKGFSLEHRTTSEEESFRRLVFDFRTTAPPASGCMSNLGNE